MYIALLLGGIAHMVQLTMTVRGPGAEGRVGGHLRSPSQSLAGPLQAVAYTDLHRPWFNVGLGRSKGSGRRQQA